MISLAKTNELYQNAPQSSSFLANFRQLSSPDSSISMQKMYALENRRKFIRAMAAEATKKSNGLLDQKMKKDALALLSDLCQVGQKMEEDLSSLPPLQATEASDGSFLVEWYLPKGRVGFNIEPEEAQSGWYYVLSSQRGDSGFLANVDLQTLLRCALEQVP
jgi:hypothetical protein